MPEIIRTFVCRTCVTRGAQYAPCIVVVPCMSNYTPKEIAKALTCVFLAETGDDKDNAEYEELK